MQKRVKFFCGAYCVAYPVKDFQGQWVTKYTPLTRQEVENADLYDIQYVDENTREIPRETILATFPQGLQGNIGIVKGQKWNLDGVEYAGRQNGVDIYKPKE